MNNYMLLSRLEMDCNYFIDHPSEKHLWAGSVSDQIKKMREIWNALAVKPEWLSLEKITLYETEMKAVKS